MPDKFDNSENEKYWEERSVEYEKAWHKRCQETVEKDLAQYYEQALKDIQDDVAALYGRFAKDNKLSMAEAHKLLTGSEYRRWRMSMEEYLQGIEEFDQKGLSRELDTLAMRSRISRLDALYAETLKSLDALGRKTEDRMGDFLSEAYKDRFYHGMYDVAEKAGTMKADVAVDDAAVAKVVGTPWSGKNYSERIWKNNAQLGNVIRTTIENGVHRGLSVPDMSRMVEEKMHAGRYNATRLVRTEMNYVQNRAALDSIKESGLKYFRFIATLDRRTSAQCREHDGRLIPVKEARTGENVPPLHPNCRSTIAGSLRGYAKQGNTRVTRNAAGKNVYVPQGITYNQWKAVYVDKSVTLEDWRLKEWRKPNDSSATASPLKSIQNARSTEELSDVMFGALKPYGIKKVDLNGSNLDIMRDQMAAWLNLTKEYKTGTVEIRIESSKGAQAKVIRVGESREAILELTKSYYNTDKERFIRWEAQDSVSTEFSLPQNPVIPADRLIIRTITHEFAHSISQSRLDPVFWKEIKAIRRRYKTALSKIDKRRIVLKEIDFEQAIKEKKKIFISEYADTNADEFFAEAFCAAKLNPNASPFAKEVLKVTDRYFKRPKVIPQGDEKILNNGIRNTQTINFGFIRTKAFHDNFKGITPHKEVNESLFRKALEILQHRSGTTFEDIAFLDARTGKLIVENNTIDVPFHAGLFDNEMKILLAHHGNYEILHNHPGSTMPSLADVLSMFRKRGASGSTVVGHNGSVYHITIEKWIDETEVAQEWETIYNGLKESHPRWDNDMVEGTAIRILIQKLQRGGVIRYVENKK